MGREHNAGNRSAPPIPRLATATDEERATLGRLTRELVAVEVHILVLAHARGAARRAATIARRGCARRAHRHVRAIDQFQRELLLARRDRARLLRADHPAVLAPPPHPGDEECDRNERIRRRAA